MVQRDHVGRPVGEGHALAVVEQVGQLVRADEDLADMAGDEQYDYT